MTRFLAALFLALAALPVPSASAAALVLVEVGGVYRLRFNWQMANAYQASETGKQVPLRRVNLRHRWPAGLRIVDRPPCTPVFVLVENGAEIGRFNGYSNPQRFNRELAGLLGRPR